MEGALVWEGYEYEHRPKSADWYWAVGIIAAALLIGALLLSYYLLGALIFFAALAIALHAAKEPKLHRFELVDRGLLIGHELYPFSSMRSFSILEYIDGDEPPVLSVKTDHWLSPHLVIPLTEVDPEAVYHFIARHVTEEEHAHTLVELVAAWLGF